MVKKKSKAKAIQRKHRVSRALEAEEAAPSKFELRRGRRTAALLSRFPQRADQAQVNITRSRTRGITKRQETLLVDLDQSQRNNIVIDQRREQELLVAGAERGIARYHHSRAGQLKRRDLFNLQDDAGMIGDGALALRSAAELEADADAPRQRLMSQAEAFKQRGQNSKREKKTARERLREIVKRDRMEKMVRHAARDEQLDELQRLDQEFTALDSVVQRPPDPRRPLPGAKKAAADDADAFDATFRALRVDHAKRSANNSNKTASAPKAKQFSVPVSLDALREHLNSAESIGDALDALAETQASRYARDKLTEALYSYCVVVARQAPLNCELLGRLIEPLYKLSCVQRAAALAAARGLSHAITSSASDSGAAAAAAAMPSVPHLVLMRIQFAVWRNTPGQRHPILAPLTLRCAQALVCAPMSAASDVFRALLCVAFVKQSIETSGGGFAPEPILFIAALLQTLLDEADDALLVFARSPNAPIDAKLLRVKKLKAKAAELTLPSVLELSASDHVELSDAERVAVISRCLGDLRWLVDQYATLPALPELFDSLDTLLQRLCDAPRVPQACRDKCRYLYKHLHQLCETQYMTRKPLTLQRRLVDARERGIEMKDVALPSRKRTADQTLRALKRTARRETRAAARELRKDSFFLARVRQQRWREEREHIDKREREIIGELQQQQADINLMEGNHKRKKTRLGKDFNAAD